MGSPLLRRHLKRDVCGAPCRHQINHRANRFCACHKTLAWLRGNGDDCVGLGGDRDLDLDDVAHHQSVLDNRNLDLHVWVAFMHDSERTQNKPRRHKQCNFGHTHQHRDHRAGQAEQHRHNQPVGCGASHSVAEGWCVAAGSVVGVGTDARISRTTSDASTPRTHSSGRSTIRWANAGMAMAFTSSGVT